MWQSLSPSSTTSLQQRGLNGVTKSQQKQKSLQRSQRQETLQISPAKLKLLNQNNQNMSSSVKPPVLSRRSIGANWQQSNIASTTTTTTNTSANGMSTTKSKLSNQKLPVDKNGVRITKHVAMDCEMVGVGFMGKTHMLARVSIVNQMGDILLDKYVKPREKVVDYRTDISGIRPADIINGEEFSKVQHQVLNLLKDRILVGHAIYNDLDVLGLKHNMKMVRDTSRYRPLAKRITGGSTPSLKTLALCVLGINIQDGEHSSVEDARAAMNIYNRYQDEWERMLKRKNQRQ